MSTPDPVVAPPPPPPPPPAKKRNPLLIGCLVILLLLVLGAGAVLLLGIYAAKKGYDEYAPKAQQALEEARKASAQVQAAAQDAQAFAQGAEAQARLAMATREVATEQSIDEVPCPPDPARATVPVDAEWFRALANGVPRAPMGTPWMRHSVFENLANVGLDGAAEEPQLAIAAIAADRDLSDAGVIAVIHPAKLEMPQAGTPGHFEGHVQLLKYPTGDSICVVSFSADSPAKAGGGLGVGRRVRGLAMPSAGAAAPSAEEDFQGAFWLAEEAALGK